MFFLATLYRTANQGMNIHKIKLVMVSPTTFYTGLETRVLIFRIQKLVMVSPTTLYMTNYEGTNMHEIKLLMVFPASLYRTTKN
jgi:hypothetical protein